MYSVKKSVSILKKELKKQKLPELMITLGSGWKHVLQKAKIEQEIPYKDLFGVAASVPGHEGKLIIAKVAGQRVVFMSGRLHMYEGYTAEEVTRPLQVMAALGLKRAVLTAATGAINEKYRVGDFVLLSDLITLFLSMENPLSGPQFQDLSQVFNEQWREQTKQVFVQEKLKYWDGVYTYCHGPYFETPADKMVLKILGTDVVGMSTVPEAIMARHLGLELLGIAFVANLAFVKHSHKDVQGAAEKAGNEMSRLIEGIIQLEKD